MVYGIFANAKVSNLVIFVSHQIGHNHYFQLNVKLLPLIIRRALVQLLNLDDVSLAEVDLLSDVVGVGELRHDRQVSRRLGKRQLGVVHDRVVVVLLSVAGGPPGKGQLSILGLLFIQIPIMYL